MKRRLLFAAVMLVGLAASATAGTLAEAKYQLYWIHSGSGPDVRVLSTDPLPAGSNVAPNNVWRYDYAVLNKSANPLYAFYAFYNSDDVNLAGWVSGTAPANWTLLKQGPASGHYNFKIRYQTTVAGSKIASGGTLLCSGTFTWTGSTVPGSQNYDAVNDGGSESGTTTEDITTPTASETWGRIKSLYR
jgi:hypothetical protein